MRTVSEDKTNGPSGLVFVALSECCNESLKPPTTSQLTVKFDYMMGSFLLFQLVTN